MGWFNTVVAGGVGYAVAGPAGAVLGVALSGGYGDDDPGYDMSDIPMGVNVEADYEDDEIGRRWTLRFLSDVPSASFAVLRLLTDTGQKLPGHAPFVDKGGSFRAHSPIHRQGCLLYIPFGAASYTSPKYISLEVAVFSAQKDGTQPVGKGTLDADLPEPQTWREADYWLPIISLCAHVGAAEARVNEGSLRPCMTRLADELEVVAGPERDDTIAGMLAHALKPLALKEAAAMARFRFPGIGTAKWSELLTVACFGDETPGHSQGTRIAEIAGLAGDASSR